MKYSVNDASREGIEKFIIISAFLKMVHTFIFIRNGFLQIKIDLILNRLKQNRFKFQNFFCNGWKIMHQKSVYII